MLLSRLVKLCLKWPKLVSQLKLNRVSGYLSTKRAYDEIRKEDGNLGLGPKTLEQFKKQMSKQKKKDQEIQV